MEQSVFLYDNFSVAADRKEVTFTFTTHKNEDSFHFNEVFVFPNALPDTIETYRLLRALHLASGISYYKIFLNADVEHPYAMSTREAGFWNSVFKNGLGEFLYVNKLDPERVAVFGPQEGHDTKTNQRVALEKKALLGIGGGKDSIVAGELLKSLHLPLEGFVLGTGTTMGQSEQVAKVMKTPLHKIQRTIDKQLIDLQERPDAYKGHIPISLIFALAGSLVACAAKHAYVVVANESSASIPRAHWAGTDVNHQWSKSFEFETLMQDYLHSYVSTDLHYFSAIRPLSSVAVSKMFCKLTPYFEVFTSDNYVFRVDQQARPTDRWSLQSPKSLSSFILLSAWLTEEQLVHIFGRDFYNENSLEHMFYSLTGIEGEQPLDCVGTPDELRASLGQAFMRSIFKQSTLMQLAKSHGIIADEATIVPTVEKFLRLSDEYSFPEELKGALINALEEGIS